MHNSDGEEIDHYGMTGDEDDVEFKTDYDHDVTESGLDPFADWGEDDLIDKLNQHHEEGTGEDDHHVPSDDEYLVEHDEHNLGDFAHPDDFGHDEKEVIFDHLEEPEVHNESE